MWGVQGEAKCRLVGVEKWVGMVESGWWGVPKVRGTIFGGGTRKTSNEINTISIRPRGKSPRSTFILFLIHIYAQKKIIYFSI